MCEPPPHNRDFSWDDLALPSVGLTSLVPPFTHKEVWRAIFLMPQDKALGPDSFTGRFFKFCWPLIQNDIMAAIDSLYNFRCQDLDLLNKAHIILIPKKDGSESISDYRHISLIHDIAKIITNMLVLRLVPLLTVYIRVKVQVDLQADKSPVVVKGPFFPRVVNPRYRIHGTM
jgi:hypothetical protein